MIRLFSLPGFLGKPDDWKILLEESGKMEHIACDYYAGHFAHPSQGLWKWAESFNLYIFNQFGPPQREHFNVLLGYSLGGRLAMHVLLQQPALWSRAILVSAHPGLDNKVERLQKQQQDEEWAKRFLTEPWEELISRWNQQPIFQNDKTIFNREEEEYDRSLLAHSLYSWSVCRQDNLKTALEKAQLPIFWIAGEQDQKYASLAQRMHFENELAQIWLVPEAGHRAPWNPSEIFIKQLNFYLSNYDRSIYSSMCAAHRCFSKN